VSPEPSVDRKGLWGKRKGGKGTKFLTTKIKKEGGEGKERDLVRNDPLNVAQGRREEKRNRPPEF